MPAPEKPNLWAIKQIAAYYGVTVSTVYRWIDAGYLPPPEKDFGSRRWSRHRVTEALRNTKK